MVSIEQIEMSFYILELVNTELELAILIYESNNFLI